MRNSNDTPGASLKFVAAAVVLVCLVLGVLGVLLPIIPGGLFFAIAAVIAANHFPGVDAWLHRNRTIGRYLDRARLIWRARTQSSKSKDR
jgi:uncharacterized membrane protein YbaN (DUF454 family)